jgi:hypothetical protein
MQPLRELRAAARLLASRPGDAMPDEAAAALAWLPIVGAGVGAAALAVDRALGGFGHVIASGAAVALLGAAWWRVRRPVLGVATTMVGALLEAVALASLPASARPFAVGLAPVFACWAMVVQCYGGTARDPTPPWGVLVGRARFREFGWASVTTLGGALVALDAVGLAVAMTAASVAVGLRGWAYRRAGGMSARGVVVTGLAVEATVMLVLAVVARSLM